MEKDFIEKAKYQEGDIHPNGKWIYKKTKSGKLEWRVIPKNSNVGAAAPTGGNKREDASSPTPANPTPANPTPANPANKKDTGANKKDTGAPKPKVVYKDKKPKYDEISVHVPETWEVTSKDGKRVIQKRDNFRKMFAGKTDDEVIARISGDRSNRYVAQIAYEEALGRGIPEDKITIGNNLKAYWNKLENEYELMNPTDDGTDDEEEFEFYDTEALRGMNVEEFMEQFPNGDRGWENINDERVMKEFKKLSTLAERQRYDAFLDYQKRSEPDYKSVKAKLQRLNIKFFGFLKHKKRPVMVSSGGAGAGKTYGFGKITDLLGMTRFDPQKHEPGDGNYSYFVSPKDPEDDAEMRAILSEHPGKVIVFDDKDKALTTTAKSYMGLMKSLGDGDPKMRIFENPKTKEQEKFTGQLVFITNKTLLSLQKDEDHKAIMSRVDKDDIQFTINETVEVLEQRYKTMGGKMDSVSPSEEKSVRKEIFNIVKNNKHKLDPKTFTVRKFEEVLSYVDTLIAAQKASDEEDAAAAMLGGGQKWQNEIISEFNKAESDEIDSKDDVLDGMDISESDKKSLKSMYKKDKKTFLELFGKQVADFVTKEETEKDIIKSFQNQLDMSLEDAEDLLLG